MGDTPPIGSYERIAVRRLTEDGRDAGLIVWFFCPGCDDAHAYRVPRWTFSGTVQKPTFRPSLLCRGMRRCHLFVTDGQIHYCGDCDHALAGKVVELPELPEWLR